MTMEKSPEDVRRELRFRMETEGALLAFETAVGICRDPKASATAKASALKALLFVGGYHGKPEPDVDKPLSEMTHDELSRAAERIRRERAALGTDQDLFD